MIKRAVLFVDDDLLIRRSVERDLASEPYKKLFAKTGEEALDLLRQEQVHVIVSDMRMPRMSGLELLGIVKQKYPRIIRLALSEYAHPTTLLTAINEGKVFKYITKPWKENGQLKTIIREAIDYYNLRNEHDTLMAQLNKYKAELEAYKKKVQEVSY